jgi:hypothetical protein
MAPSQALPLSRKRDEAKSCLRESSMAKLWGRQGLLVSCHAGALMKSVPEGHETWCFDEPFPTVRRCRQCC